MPRFKQSARLRMAGALGSLALVAAGLVGLGASPAQAASTCEKFASFDVGKFVVMNNKWGTDAEQCIETLGSGFRITSQRGVAPTNGAPVSYPAIYVGCHYTKCSSGTNLPARISGISAVPSSISYNYVGGTYDAAYDIWLDSTPKRDGVNQTEIMIWFNRQGPIQPIGSRIGDANVGGRNWEVWTGSNGQNAVISFVAPSPITSWSFNTLDFINQAVERRIGGATRDWYLTSIQAGFEPWNGGAGLAVTSFAQDVQLGNNGGGTGGGTGGGGGATTTIVGQASNRCVDVNAWGKTNGTKIQLWDCFNNGAQQWRRSGNTFVNPNSGKCLDVSGGRTANGTIVQLWDCLNNGAQQWVVNGNGTIVNPNSGKCLDAKDLGTGNGTQLQIWDCGSGSNQRWRLT